MSEKHTCPNCQNEIQANARYCSFCGKEITKEEQSQQEKIEKDDIIYTSNKKTLAISIASILLFAFIIFCFILAANNLNGIKPQMIINGSNNNNTLLYRPATVDDIEANIIPVSSILKPTTYTLYLQANEEIENLELKITYYSKDGIFAEKEIFIGKVVPGNNYIYDVTYPENKYFDVFSIKNVSYTILNGKIRR